MLLEIINFTDFLMRTLLAVFILPIVFLGCSSVEQTTEKETEEEAPAELNTAAPNWFDPLETSASDSMTVHGFALASDVDSIEAVALAENTALTNLRYEIDYLTESTREHLAEEENISAYSSVSFIVKLRNLVRDLPVQEAELDFKTIRSDSDIYSVYAKASLAKNTLWDMFSDRLNDSDFLNALESSSAEQSR